MKRPLADFGAWYAARGWHISPLRPLAKIPFGNCDVCRAPAKDRPNPAYKPHDAEQCPCIAAGGWCHGLKAATANLDIIAGWAQRCPGANIAVHMERSGLIVLDFDDHPDTPRTADPLPGLEVPADVAEQIHNGADTFEVLRSIRGQGWPNTLTVSTPSGRGRQQWYTLDRTDLVSSAGVLGWQIDVKAGPAYAVAPGSRTRVGLYEVIVRMDPEPLPAWVIAELDRTGHIRQAPPARPSGWAAPRLTGGRRYVEVAVAAELSEVASAAPGQRHHQLVKSSHRLGRFVGAGLIDRAAAHDALTAAAEAAGVSPHENKAQGTIRSGLDRGAAHPFTLPDPRQGQPR